MDQERPIGARAAIQTPKRHYTTLSLARGIVGIIVGGRGAPSLVTKFTVLHGETPPLPS